MKIVMLVSAYAARERLPAALMDVMPLLVAANPTGALLYIEDGACTAIDMLVAGRHGYRLCISGYTRRLRSIPLGGDTLDLLRERLTHGADVDPMNVPDIARIDRFLLFARPT